ncbi:dimethyl sulfoxide reductase anchor subunit [Aromatoleum anaerobium]|uniref:Phenylacetyl-CoA:acceptor oxidoreductase n=1 Tax=Aromatoleum anaerobium TaxID=182180 RepID=A0ABX1PHF7_9RHOO|nr:dimethyl sulfoxide reductase anchor subunit [Aromatoleum anaerobium]MCK0509068.1 dimethyl sulfoxide reductase anchor subunit [Aromatoleum anaerobium]
MKPTKFSRFGTSHQAIWDWRAAGNFICGGAGSSLLAVSTFAAFPGVADGRLLLLAVLLIGAGLAFVWTEIGRPWRAFNVLFHPQTSWMTREAYVAALIVALLAAGAATGVAFLSHIASLAALLFLYCQGRILKAARGIPTWREPAIVPLIVATGLVEGLSLLVLIVTMQGAAVPAMFAALILLVALRAAAWLRYRSRMNASDMPLSTRRVLQSSHLAVLGVGTAVPLVAAALALAVPMAALAGALAALAAAVAGWHFKLLLITRAAQVQGYALGNKLRRGHPFAAR